MKPKTYKINSNESFYNQLLLQTIDMDLNSYQNVQGIFHLNYSINKNRLVYKNELSQSLIYSLSEHVLTFVLKLN